MFNRSLVAVVAGATLASPALAAPLTVNLDGVKDIGATLYVGVQTEEQFMDWDGIAGEKIEAAWPGSHSFTFDLPEGEYSVTVWHDLNGNQQFDMADSGMPDEGWAMSNASELRGEPTFEDVKVTLGADGAAITETVNYPR